MQKGRPSARTGLRLIAISMLAMGLAACSSSGRGTMSLLLEQEKTAIQKKVASSIGSTPEEMKRAFDSSEATDRKRAQQVAAKTVARYGRSDDKAMQAHLQRVTDRLASAIESGSTGYKVMLVKDDQVNAFTPGGGIIVVHEGLLSFTDTEGQIAAVLAHEIAHVLQKHPYRLRQFRLASKAGGSLMDAITPDVVKDNLGKVVRLGGKASINAAIRRQEAEADSIAIDLLVAAGYDPNEMVSVQRQLMTYVPQSSRLANMIYGQHPLSKDRVVAAERKIAKYYPDVQGQVTSAQFEKLIRGYQQRRLKRLASKL